MMENYTVQSEQSVVTAIEPTRRTHNNRRIGAGAAGLILATSLVACTAAAKPNPDTLPSAVTTSQPDMNPHNDPHSRSMVLSALREYHQAQVIWVDSDDNNVSYTRWSTLHQPAAGDVVLVTFDGQTVDQLSIEAGKPRDISIPDSILSIGRNALRSEVGVVSFADAGTDCGFLAGFTSNDGHGGFNSNCIPVSNGVTVSD